MDTKGVENYLKLKETYFGGKDPEIVELEGRLDSWSSQAKFEPVFELIESGKHNIAIDLSRVDYMSSSGLRQVLKAGNECREHNRGDLVVVDPPKRVIEALDLAGFIDIDGNGNVVRGDKPVHLFRSGFEVINKRR